MSKLERLLKLLAILLDTTVPLSAEDLRRRLGGYPDNDASFRRAFERDKDDIRQLGVTIQKQNVPDRDPPVEGYFIDQVEYAGKDPGLEADELTALHLAAALVRVEDLGDDALWKLGGRPTSQAPDAEPAVHLASTEQTNNAGILQVAIAKRQLVRFTYGDVDRELEPARLSFKRGRWYVSGIDRSRGAERVFRLDRIETAIEVGEANAFEAQTVRGPQVTRTWELGDQEPLMTQVQIESEVAAWAKLQLEPSEVEEQSDGSIVANLSVRNPEHFRDWVLSFYDNAVVLGPPEMRTMMIDWLEGMVTQ